MLALVQSSQQVSLYAEPVQSLPYVANQLCHAALLTQRLHHRVQLLEEILALSGQSVRRLPVFVAPQDVVCDVNVTGSHVVNPLGNCHAAR